MLTVQALFPPNMKIDAGTRGRGDAQRGTFMHGGENLFFHGDCLLPPASCLLPPAFKGLATNK